ncbi:MAG: ATP-binding protein [Spirochaetales bacterium]|nr:ATP-binding protein [Spirochaetales bacterium]
MIIEKERIYSAVLAEHLSQYRQMAFVTGPRQVGKTTTCRKHGVVYLDWDNEDHRDIILKGPAAIADYAGISQLAELPRVIVFDELHKYKRWKQLLKGFFDTYENNIKLIVTGSSRLDVYRRGGDSLMGRYFLYHMHPFSVAELAHTGIHNSIINSPTAIDDSDWEALWRYGGFPEPFIERNVRFSRRWSELRDKQLFKEDVRDLTRIQELAQLETLGKILGERSGGQIIYSNLSRIVRVSENTVRSWIETLISLHYGFLIRPWYSNVEKGLRKEPKWFLRDWSSINDPGKRAETFVACHLLKSVEGWTDLGLGIFELRYVRDKQKREVDFLIIKDNKPWMLVEAKLTDTMLSPSLEYFKKQISCPYAFQVVIEKAFIDRNCFDHKVPIVVPARTLLSQLF